MVEPTPKLPKDPGAYLVCLQKVADTPHGMRCRLTYRRLDTKEEFIVQEELRRDVVVALMRCMAANP